MSILSVEVDLVVTQHGALLQLLKELGLATESTKVISHVTDPSVLDGKVTAGILPMHLAARSSMHIEIPLAVTAEERASRAELTIERLREIAGKPVAYRVTVARLLYP